jgi:DNA-binding NarL/FixJ family response regulator
MKADSSHHLLVVDDDPDSIEVFKLLLENEPYHIVGTTNPQEAVEIAQRVKPDLILLDWQMPNKGGIEVMMEIKQVESLCEIPIIIATGIHTTTSNLSEAIGFGATDFIRKPIDKLELVARVRAAIRSYEFYVHSLNLKATILQNEIQLAETRSKLLQSELSKKEREMIFATVNMFQNQKLLEVLRHDLLDVPTSLAEPVRMHVETTLSKYESLSTSFNWTLFEKRFTELHHDFYAQLSQKYPDLTQHEIKLCAYTRLGLNKKEIALLMYSSYEAVRKSTYRIRKKMNIRQTMELTLLLQSI